MRDSGAVPHEEKRAEFCRDWLLRNGASPEQVHIDEALNVVCEVPGETDEVIVFMAHTDTVFPDLEPLPYHEENGRMFCPGIGDDTANLAVLLMLAKYVLTRGLRSKYTVVFAANSCEEGLGNLKGSFQLMRTMAAVLWRSPPLTAITAASPMCSGLHPV